MEGGIKIGGHLLPQNGLTNHADDVPLQDSHPLAQPSDTAKGSLGASGGMATEMSTECNDSSDCTFDAMCVPPTGSKIKHCICYETGTLCAAKTKQKDTTKRPPQPAKASSPSEIPDFCVEDSDCGHYAWCAPDHHGNKRCFCADSVEFCKPLPVVPESPCGSGCSANANCDPKLGCICTDTLKPEKNGTCPKNSAETVIHNTTPSDIFRQEVLHKEQIHKILNSTAANQTMVMRAHSNSQSTSVPLHVILPLGLLLGIIGVIITIICLRRQRQHRLGPKRSSEAVVKSGDGVMLLDRMNNINKNPTYFVSPGDDPAQRKFLVREICMDHVLLVDVVGEGAFGQVYRGELHCPETNTSQLVAVKVLKENVSNEIREDFEREVEIMSAFDHDNILKLVGVVSQNAGQSPYMIFEYMVHGDLAELLRKNDPVLLKKDSDVIRLQKPDLVDIATQIANGMRYLTSQHFVHRDLATRNCLVGEQLVVKISDFGMSRDIYTCDYYKIGGSRMLPVRWMSPESVKYGRFTSESDAWAYGVVLWEIFSCGRQPYYGHSNEEVVRFLDAGILLQRPEDCPSTIYHIMLGCWKADPKERLSFDKIAKHLQDYHQHLVKMAAASTHSQPTTPVANEGVGGGGGGGGGGGVGGGGGTDLQQQQGVKMTPPPPNPAMAGVNNLTSSTSPSSSPDSQQKLLFQQDVVIQQPKFLQGSDAPQQQQPRVPPPPLPGFFQQQNQVHPQEDPLQAKLFQEQEIAFSPRPKQMLKGTMSDPQTSSRTVNGNSTTTAPSPSPSEKTSRTSPKIHAQHNSNVQQQQQPDQQHGLTSEIFDAPDAPLQIALPPLSPPPPAFHPPPQTPPSTPLPPPPPPSATSSTPPQLSPQLTPPPPAQVTLMSESPFFSTSSPSLPSPPLPPPPPPLPLPLTLENEILSEGHPGFSAEKLHSIDSGFSSGEQQFDEMGGVVTGCGGGGGGLQTPTSTLPEVQTTSPTTTEGHGGVVVEPLTSIVCAGPAEVV